MYCKCKHDMGMYEIDLGINSSKVYCKCKHDMGMYEIDLGINSSKVYCKFFTISTCKFKFCVLIVAKCIVNIY